MGRTVGTYVLLLSLLLLICVNDAVGQRKSNKPKPRPTTAAPEVDEEGVTDECPEPNGFFADAVQCDKYYACVDGVITEKLCPDGMVFNDFSPKHEKCDLPFGIDCSNRPQLQDPQPSENCPRKHGYFAHKDVNICDKFFYCVDGTFNPITCPAGLVYSDKTGTCSWPDEAKKKHCSSEDVFSFACPAVNETYGLQHPRYADPDDCQYFYVCVNGVIPRRNGCKRGQVFNEASGKCDWPRHVPECKEWYKGIISDEELALLENPKPKAKPSEEAVRRRQGTRKKPARPSVPVAEEDE